MSDESGKVFAAVDAQANPLTGNVGPDEIRNIRHSHEVFVSLDKDFNVLYASADVNGNDWTAGFTHEIAAKSEFLLRTQVDSKSGTARLSGYHLKGRDGQFFDGKRFSGGGPAGGNYDNPVYVPMDQHGYVDFKKPEVKAAVVKGFLPLLNMCAEKAATEAANEPVPERWKTGLPGAPSKAVTVEPATEEPARRSHGLIGVVERLEEFLATKPLAKFVQSETPQSEGVPGRTPPGNPALIRPKGKSNTP
jgi:hypothetical protein